VQVLSSGAVCDSEGQQDVFGIDVIVAALFGLGYASFENGFGV
jgi:hypothetical protein